MTMIIIIIVQFVAHLIIIIIHLSWLEFVHHLLGVRLYIKHVTCITSFNPPNISVR